MNRQQPLLQIAGEHDVIRKSAESVKVTRTVRCVCELCVPLFPQQITDNLKLCIRPRATRANCIS